MKRILLLMIALCATYGLQGQENFSALVKVGDKLVIAEPSSHSYQHIAIPRKNFIIKRGGIANMASIENAVVTITKITAEENPEITFKRSNGKKFFRVYKTLTADLNNAINSGELKIRTNGKKDSLAK